MTSRLSINTRTPREIQLGVNNPVSARPRSLRNHSARLTGGTKMPPASRPAGFRFLWLYPHQWAQLFGTLTILLTLFVALQSLN